MLELKPLNFDQDISHILNLTKEHLDDSFSKDFFFWKHIENPFGISYAMGAWDSNKLVGLRMFMCWEFVGKNQKIIKSIRPVDTVTHKDYRGKGIFKTLTLEGLELFKGEYEIVFNTPNQNSLPGYLKMGWHKIEISHSFIYALANPFSKKYGAISFADSLNELSIIKPKVGETNLTETYLKWRYQDKSFCFATFSTQAFVIYKIGKFKGLKTIVIYEVSGDNKFLSALISAIALKEKTIIFYGFFGNRTNYLNFKLIFKRNIPVVVFRDDTNEIHKQFNFSLGDLEGKL